MHVVHVVAAAVLLLAEPAFGNRPNRPMRPHKAAKFRATPILCCLEVSSIVDFNIGPIMYTL